MTRRTSNNCSTATNLNLHQGSLPSWDRGRNRRPRCRSPRSPQHFIAEHSKPGSLGHGAVSQELRHANCASGPLLISRTKRAKRLSTSMHRVPSHLARRRRKRRRRSGGSGRAYGRQRRPSKPVGFYGSAVAPPRVAPWLQAVMGVVTRQPARRVWAVCCELLLPAGETGLPSDAKVACSHSQGSSHSGSNTRLIKDQTTLLTCTGLLRVFRVAGLEANFRSCLCIVQPSRPARWGGQGQFAVDGPWTALKDIKATKALASSAPHSGSLYRLGFVAQGLRFKVCGLWLSKGSMAIVSEKRKFWSFCVFENMQN